MPLHKSSGSERSVDGRVAPAVAKVDCGPTLLLTLLPAIPTLLPAAATLLPAVPTLLPPAVIATLLPAAAVSNIGEAAQNHHL